MRSCHSILYYVVLRHSRQYDNAVPLAPREGGPLYAKTPAIRRLPGTIILCHETPHGGAGFHDALACAALLPLANNNIRASKGKLGSTDFVLRGAYLGDAI